MHIYQISRLYQRPVGKWLNILKSVDARKDFMPKQYIHLRLAIVAEVNRYGSGKPILDAGLALESKAKNHKTICDNCRKAFGNFCNQVSGEIESLSENYLLPTYRPDPIEFEGHPITGKFHFSATCKKGNLIYAHLHPSRWTKDETESYLEILTIIAEKRHGLTRENVWFIDLQKGEVIRPKASYVTVRRQLKETMDTFKLLSDAYGSSINFDEDDRN